MFHLEFRGISIGFDFTNPSLKRRPGSSRRLRHWIGASVMLLTLCAVVICVLIFLWRYPSVEVASLGMSRSSPDFSKRVNEVRATWAQIMAGTALLLGLSFAAWQAATASRNARLTENGQITERLSRAVQQLADDKTTIRLGGIYALQRLAWDSRQDYWTVIQVLRSYLHEHTSVRSSDRLIVEFQAEADVPENGNALTVDAKAVLEIISHRRWARDEHRAGHHLEFDGLELSGAVLQEAVFDYSDFVNCRMEKLGAFYCRFCWTIFSRSNVQDGVFSFCKMQDVLLMRSEMVGVHFSECDLRRAKISDMNLSESKFILASAARSRIERVNFTGAVFSGSDFRWCLLTDVRFDRADLRDMDLRGAILTNVSVLNTEFGNTRLEGSDLTQVHDLTKEQLTNCTTDEFTKLPNYLVVSNGKETGVANSQAD